MLGSIKEGGGGERCVVVSTSTAALDLASALCASAGAPPAATSPFQQLTKATPHKGYNSQKLKEKRNECTVFEADMSVFQVLPPLPVQLLPFRAEARRASGGSTVTRGPANDTPQTHEQEATFCDRKARNRIAMPAQPCWKSVARRSSRAHLSLHTCRSTNLSDRRCYSCGLTARHRERLQFGAHQFAGTSLNHRSLVPSGAPRMLQHLGMQCGLIPPWRSSQIHAAACRVNFAIMFFT